MASSRSFTAYQGCPSTPLQHCTVLEYTANKRCVLCFDGDAVFTLELAVWAGLKATCTRLCTASAFLGVLSLAEGADSFAHHLVLVSNSSLVGQLSYCDVHRISGVQLYPLRAKSPSANAADPRLLQIQKLLTCGLFLFGWSVANQSYVDLSSCAQSYYCNVSTDSRFHWNHALGCHLKRHGIVASEWLTPCIGGVVEIKTVYIGTQVAKACLISRISSDRMGTRFNVRGVNDFGHVANFVETEQVIYFEDHVVSFVQTRGSVPLFWDQPGIQVGSHKIKVNRSLGATAAAYKRHIRLMKALYTNIAVVNLLSCKGDEGTLSEAYKYTHDNFAEHDKIPFYCFDLRSQAKGGDRLISLNSLWLDLEDFVSRSGLFHCRGSKVISKQTGVLRVNCLDCLDRTNSCQSYFGRQVLKWQLIALGLDGKENICIRFLEIYKTSWTQNGDQCSKLYTGTAAQEGKSKIKDASITVSRTIQSNLMDKPKQQAINCLLRNCEMGAELVADVNCRLCCKDLLAYPSICRAMLDDCSKYMDERCLSIFCGTWNVNGGQLTSSVVFRQDSTLDAWLLNFGSESDSRRSCDVYAIGLEEIVDLNASNVLNVSVRNQDRWRESILSVLNGSDSFVFVESVQLVGICLFIFARPQLVPYIRDVSTAAVKTGFGGTMGNKGGTAVSLTIFNSSFCFVCSHFAAGQSQVQERNEDYDDTWRKMRFPSGVYVFSHDFVFWFGDFNYRIDMTGDEVKRAVESGQLTPLQMADQLNQQKAAGNIFSGFEEGPLNFAPTYKYDAFSDDYDTSEKARTPAWTDRVLYWERAVRRSSSTRKCQLRYYGRSELKTSDHRPVAAVFDAVAMAINWPRFREALTDTVCGMGPLDAAVLVRLNDGSDVAPFLGIIRQKIEELSLQVCCVKYLADHLLCMFGKSEDALAALSMDGVSVDKGRTLMVEFKNGCWQEEALQVVQGLQQNVESDELIEEEVSGAAGLRLLSV